jgi:NAD(P)-dependent dehydrogenase (short-subunit alcohol dehydrogenase family)
MAHSRNHVIVLTGASRGIGKHLALALVKTGYSVAMGSRHRTTDPELLEAIETHDTRVREWELDITDYQCICTLVDQILAWQGRIDVLINNAGQKLFDEFLGIAPVQFEQVVHTNLIGPVSLCYQVVPLMLKQGYGRIINMSSRAGLEFYGQGTAYCSSKAGLIGFSQSLADALKGTGINVNVLCPPTILTPEYLEQKPNLDRRHLVKVQQIIRVVLDLLNPDCKVTGRIFPFYSSRSFVKSMFMDIHKYIQLLPQLRYRLW